MTNTLDNYPEKFANQVIQYPYIGSKAFNLLRKVKMHSSDEKGGMCGDCFGKECEKIKNDIDLLTKDEKIGNSLKTFCNQTFGYLYPTKAPEAKLLFSIEESIQNKHLRNLRPLQSKAWALANLRNSQAFNALPQLNQSDLLNIDEAVKNNYASKGLNTLSDKEFALKSLNLDYNPSMPIEEYLDTIVPRKQKINKLVEGLLTSKDRNKEILQIQEEIWKINKEISSSKKIETLTWTTNILFNNIKVLSTALIGALIGYTSGNFTACGLGGAGGFVAGEVINKVSGKYGDFKIPKYPAKTAEWLKSKIEGSEERVLATVLSKDIKAIQVWSLRKKLNK